MVILVLKAGNAIAHDDVGHRDSAPAMKIFQPAIIKFKRSPSSSSILFRRLARAQLGIVLDRVLEGLLFQNGPRDREDQVSRMIVAKVKLDQSLRVGCELTGGSRVRRLGRLLGSATCQGATSSVSLFLA